MFMPGIDAFILTSFASSIFASKAMARSTAGSPAIFKKTKAGAVPRRCRQASRAEAGVQPCAKPLLVAGESEQMAAVMHEFMHVHATDQGGRTFFGPNEIDRQKEKQATENRPWKHLADGNGGLDVVWARM